MVQFSWKTEFIIKAFSSTKSSAVNQKKKKKKKHWEDILCGWIYSTEFFHCHVTALESRFREILDN